MPEPRNQGIGSYRQEIGNLNAPDIRPVMPERTEPYDMGAAVQKIVGAIGGVVQQWSNLKEGELNKALDMERIEVATNLANVDYSKIDMQPGEQPSDAAARYLPTLDWFPTLHPQTKARVTAEVASGLGQVQRAAAKDALREVSWQSGAKMQAGLVDAKQRATMLTLYPGYLTQSVAEGRSHQEAQQAFTGAMYELAAKGDMAGTAELAEYAGTVGLGDEAARAMTSVRQTHNEMYQTAIAVRMDEAAKITDYDQRSAALTQLEREMQPYQRTPSDVREAHNWVETLRAGQKIPEDPTAILENERIMQSLSAGSSQQDRAGARTAILANARRAGPIATAKSLGEVETRLAKIDTDLVNSAINAGVAAMQVPEADVGEFRRVLEDWRHKNPTAEPKALYVFAKGAAARWSEREKQTGVPAATRRKIRGALQSGAYAVNDYGEIKRFPTASDAIAWVTLNYGGWGWTSDPEMLADAQQAYPLATWNTQTDEQKSATLERARNTESYYPKGPNGDIETPDAKRAKTLLGSDPATPEAVAAFGAYLRSENKTLLPAPTQTGIRELPSDRSQLQPKQLYRLRNGQIGRYNGGGFDMVAP